MKHLAKFLLIATLSSQAQNRPELAVDRIPAELKENAYSVVRNNKTSIYIEDVDKMEITYHKEVTVFQEKGMNNVDAREYYSASEKLRDIEATVYDASGQKIKTIKKSDFVDFSVADGFSIITDNRCLSLDYTPSQYPLTIVYDARVISKNTAFIPGWYPIDDYHESVERSEFDILFPEGITWKHKAYNLIPAVQIKQTPQGLHGEAIAIKAVKKEPYAPTFTTNMPRLMCAMTPFYLEGVEGRASSWNEFGQWVNQSLLAQSNDLSEATKKIIHQKTDNLKDPLEKAKAVYAFVQQKTRYISVQLGIGGWRPMKASEVDRWGYGDCKALTNYTYCLMQEVGLPAYYTLIYAGEDQRSMDEELLRMQGNHAILTLKMPEKLYFLECTSQSAPFGYQGDFTDNRKALMITPDGAQFVQSNGGQLNSYIRKGTHLIKLGNEGQLSATSALKSEGEWYDEARILLNKSKDKVDNHFADMLRHIPHANVVKHQLKDKPEQYEFEEIFEAEAPQYWQSYQEYYAFCPVLYNNFLDVPQRLRNRVASIEFKRVYTIEDTYTIEIPNHIHVHQLPQNVNIDTAFGHFEIQYEQKQQTLICHRVFTRNQGIFPAADYEKYRIFMDDCVKAESQKVLLK